MSQATLSVRVNSEDKKNFEDFCEQAGMNVSVAVNMFVKAVIREQKLPFEVKIDPFYSRENMERLEKSVQQLKDGNGVPADRGGLMQKIWSDEAWEDYLYWQTQDKKILKRINNNAIEIAQCGSHYKDR